MALRTERKKPKPEIASVRRTQLITTYGIGALIPVESESFIVLGQNSWPERALSHHNEIREPALAQMLRVERFYQPPSGNMFRLPLRRFPEMVTCPRCSRLERFWKIARKDGKGDYRNECRHCEVKTALVPSRFIGACTDGHLQDFPYSHWVHQRSIPAEEQKDHQLKLISDSANGSLAGLIVRCSCGDTRSMAGALGKGLKSKCFSQTPWLIYGRDEDKEFRGKQCTEPLRGLQRGASNVWYADIKSVIRIDRDESPAERLLAEYPDFLSDPSSEEYDVELKMLSRKSKDVSPEALRQAHIRSIQESDSPDAVEGRLREEEYEALKRNHSEVDGDELFVCKVHSRDDSDSLPRFLSSVSEVPRLRVVNALTSFTRVEGVSDDRKSRAMLSSKRENWLPAIEIFGEGIFLEVDQSKLALWEASASVQERAERINRAVAKTSGIAADATPRFLFLHSLSHALMRELALQTGYPATSIQERIYAGKGQAGILLFTASADAAGSLGGLTSHGKPDTFTQVFESAIEGAQWCSADPVCIESDVHGVNNMNLAACHYCLLAPEVSCEARNSLLDRACLVGAPHLPDLGFFS